MDLPHRPPSQGDDHALKPFFTLPVRADAAPAAVRPAAPTYRFTIAVSATLNALRKQLYYERRRWTCAC